MLFFRISPVITDCKNTIIEKAQVEGKGLSWKKHLRFFYKCSTVKPASFSYRTPQIFHRQEKKMRIYSRKYQGSLRDTYCQLRQEKSKTNRWMIYMVFSCWLRGHISGHFSQNETNLCSHVCVCMWGLGEGSGSQNLCQRPVRVTKGKSSLYMPQSVVYEIYKVGSPIVPCAGLTIHRHVFSLCSPEPQVLPWVGWAAPINRVWTYKTLSLPQGWICLLKHSPPHPSIKWHLNGSETAKISHCSFPDVFPFKCAERINGKRNAVNYEHSLVSISTLLVTCFPESRAQREWVRGQVKFGSQKK